MINKKILVPVAIAILAASILIGMSFVSKPSFTPSYFDENVISLERTACYGPCPVYSVTVFKSGRVIFEGMQNTENVGVFAYRIPTSDAEKIFDKFYEINFFALDDKYTRNVTDLPTAITSFRNDAYSKTVSNYGNAGPDSLHHLELLIDKMARTEPMINDAIPEIPKSTTSIYDMKPNSMEYFYYPNPENTENRDVFQKFILIRLPEEFGGDADDVSTFRAYSALSVSNHCLIKYWPQEGRKRMEDPCWGTTYRPTDGLATRGPKPIVNTAPVALPYLELSSDANGTLYVEPPVWTLQENGVVGIGRQISSDEIHQGSQLIVDAYKRAHPNYPDIPVEFAGNVLAEINDSNGIEARYTDFSVQSWNYVSIQTHNVSAQDQQYTPDLADPNSQFWQIGDSVIRVGGPALDKDSKQQDEFKQYDVEFTVNGFKFTVKGKNVDFIKKEIVKYYFPEYSYDDLVLISENMEQR